MASAFSSSDTAALEREVDTNSAAKWNLENVWDDSQKSVCIEWVNKNKFAKVCLQFPDDQLTFSTRVLEELKSDCPGVQFFILADTSYGSCCVDEIAAAHVQADSVVHFGNACQSKVTRLPVFYVFPHLEFDCDNFVNCISNLNLDNSNGSCQTIDVFFELSYQHVIDDAHKNVMLERLQALPIASGRTIVLQKYPGNISSDQSANENRDVCIFVGHDDQTFFNIGMSLKASDWFLYDPEQKTLLKTDPMTTQWVRRRYFYISKCKEAQTIGLIVATLTADGYLDVVKRIQEMARARGKRTYIISVGRINPAKLANFMEIDCFVLIGCPFNNIYTSRDFYKPMVSVFEAELALNPAWNNKLPETYSLDFKDVLPEGKQYHEFNPADIEENDVSLVSGNLMRGRPDMSIGGEMANGHDGAITERKNYQLMETNGGTVFEDRSWRGLEQNLGRTEPAKITKGLSGIPTNYTHD